MADEPERRQFRKRAPSIQTTVKELDKNMNRIAVVGTIVSRNESITTFLLDDGTGAVNVIMNDAERFGQLKDGQIVRVLGKIWGEGEDIEVQGDIVQDFDNLDLNLFKKIFSK